MNVTSVTTGDEPVIEVDILAVFHWWRKDVTGSMQAFSEHLRLHIQSLLSQTEFRNKKIKDQWVQSFVGEVRISAGITRLTRIKGHPEDLKTVSTPYAS